MEECIARLDVRGNEVVIPVCKVCDVCMPCEPFCVFLYACVCVYVFRHAHECTGIPVKIMKWSLEE